MEKLIGYSKQILTLKDFNNLKETHPLVSFVREERGWTLLLDKNNRPLYAGLVTGEEVETRIYFYQP